MTHEQEQLLKAFQTRVRQVMMECDKLRRQNGELRQALKEKDLEYNQALDDLRALAKKYDNLSTALCLTGESGEDVSSAKRRLTKLVREIDACIRIVDESQLNG